MLKNSYLFKCKFSATKVKSIFFYNSYILNFRVKVHFHMHCKTKGKIFPHFLENAHFHFSWMHLTIVCLILNVLLYLNLNIEQTVTFQCFTKTLK